MHSLHACTVTIEEVGQVLPAIPRPSQSTEPPSLKSSFPINCAQLASLYQRLQPRERKWITRLVLKDYSPIAMPVDLVTSLYHPLLPGLLQMHVDLPVALRLLDKIGDGDAFPDTPLPTSDPAEPEKAVATEGDKRLSTPPPTSDPVESPGDVAGMLERDVSVEQLAVTRKRTLSIAKVIATISN